jgi:ABC-type nitrate/sulfonate/bicarbonate transport system permease component
MEDTIMIPTKTLVLFLFCFILFVAVQAFFEPMINEIETQTLDQNLETEREDQAIDLYANLVTVLKAVFGVLAIGLGVAVFVGFLTGGDRGGRTQEDTTYGLR